MQRGLAGSGVGLVTVGFSPPEAMGVVAEHLSLTGPVLSDEQRVLYRRLRVGRAPLWRVYSPRTVSFYLRAARRGAELSRPVEDTRQLGADALLRDGVVTRRWLPRTPSDRADPTLLVAAARRSSAA